MAEGPGGMRRFYTLLGAVALVGGGLIWFAAREQPAGPARSMVAPVAAVDGFRGYTLGSDSAPVEITEYLDFECPACARFAILEMPVLRQQLIATGKIRWRSRDFPLPSHRYSRYSAHAAHCAAEQGKYWEMHDQLFFNHTWAQTGKNPRGLFRDFAKAIGLNRDAYDACMDSERYAARIEASRQEGEALRIPGTPTFFINGRQLPGIPNSDDLKGMVHRLNPPAR